MYENYEKLMLAIYEQATEDYTHALMLENSKQGTDKTAREIREDEEFFIKGEIGPYESFTEEERKQIVTMLKRKVYKELVYKKNGKWVKYNV